MGSPNRPLTDPSNTVVSAAGWSPTAWSIPSPGELPQCH